MDKARDRGNGQYVTYLERVCVCGHSLGDHTAARVNGEQPCIEHECDGCMCRSFKAAKPEVAHRG